MKKISNTLKMFYHFSGQSPSFKTLFFCILFERFAYYGMRSLLVLYMYYIFIDHPGIHDVFGKDWIFSLSSSTFSSSVTRGDITQIYGFIVALFYLTPVLGGYFADMFIGRKWSVLIGAFWMLVGYLLMTSKYLFFLSIPLLIFGQGLFKPNIISLLGSISYEDESQKSKAFSLFYLAICMGAFLAPIVCGTLGQQFGLRLGFLLSAIGMLFSLIVSIFYFQRNLNSREALPTHIVPSYKEYVHIKPVFLIISVIMVNSLFWCLFEMQGGVLQLVIHENINWKFLNYDIPSTFFQSFGALFVILLTPLSLRLSQKRNFDELSKMSISFVLVGISYFYFFAIISYYKPYFSLMIIFSLIFTLGELLLGPVQIEFVSKYSPQNFKGTLMGFCFISHALGGILSGYLGKYFYSNGTGKFLVVSSLMAALGFLSLTFLKKLSRKRSNATI